MATVLSATFIIMFIVIVVYGIFTRDTELINRILAIISSGIAFSCAWAGGRSLLRRSRRSMPSEPHAQTSNMQSSSASQGMQKL
jgi:hypothetical protein